MAITSSSYYYSDSFEFDLSSFNNYEEERLKENSLGSLSNIFDTPTLEEAKKKLIKIQQETWKIDPEILVLLDQNTKGKKVSFSDHFTELSLDLSKEENAKLATYIGLLFAQKKLKNFLQTSEKSHLSRSESNDYQFKFAINVLVHSAKFDLPNTLPLLERIEPQKYQLAAVNRIALGFVKTKQLEKVVEVAKCLPKDQREKVIFTAGFELNSKEYIAISSFIRSLAKTHFYIALQFTDECISDQIIKKTIIHQLARNSSGNLCNPITSIIKALLKQNVSKVDAAEFLKYATGEPDKKAATALLMNNP